MSQIKDGIKVCGHSNERSQFAEEEGYLQFTCTVEFWFHVMLNSHLMIHVDVILFYCIRFS